MVLDVAVFLVVLALIGFAIYRSDVLAPKAPQPKGETEKIAPEELNAKAEAPDAASVTTVKEYKFRPAERQSAPHMALWEVKLRACVDALEHEAVALGAGPLTIGHIAIGTALGEFRGLDRSTIIRRRREKFLAIGSTLA